MRDDKISRLLRVGEAKPGMEDDPRVAALSELVRAMGDPPPDREAPVREVIARLGDNWSPLILKILSTGAYRHTTLKRVIGEVSAEAGISQRMLTLRLRALERDGFVAREFHDTVPPRVVYSLTPLGAGLADELDRLLGWVERNSREIERARLAFRD